MNAGFDFKVVKPHDVKVSYSVNILRVETIKPDVIFGTITDLDGTMYECRELHFHTPAEHTM